MTIVTAPANPGYVSLRERSLDDADNVYWPDNGDMFYGHALSAPRTAEFAHIGIRPGALIHIVNPTTHALTVRDYESGFVIGVVRESPSAGQYRRSLSIYRSGVADSWVALHGELFVRPSEQGEPPTSSDNAAKEQHQ